MDALDQMLATQAGVTPTPGASAPVSGSAPATGGIDPLDALLSTRAQGNQVASAPAPNQGAATTPQPSFMDQLGRQVGLTARHAITGLTALPAMVGDAANTAENYGVDALNKYAGTNLPHAGMVSQAIQQGENAIGLPQPQTPTERVVGDATSAMAGVVPSVGLGKLLAGAASPVASTVGQALQAIPGAQVLGAAGSGAGSGTARELGMSPVGQFAAGILGGAGGIGAGSLATAGLRGLGNAATSAMAPPMSPVQAAARAQQGVNQVVSELGPQGAQSFGQPSLEPTPQQPAPVQNPGAPPQTGGAAPPLPPVSPAQRPAPAGPGPLGGFNVRPSSTPELDTIRQQIAPQIQQNPTADPAAVIRSNDFRNLGIQPTLGQITRDPTQFANEQNMRGAPNVGAPLTQRFNTQNTQLQQNLFSLAGQPADNFTAGTNLQTALQGIDSQMSQQVTDAYNAARASTGKNLDVPLAGVAQDYAQVLNDFGDKVPSGVQNNFNALGLQNGTQQKMFTMENAENLLKVINANQSNDPATNAALGTLRNSVKNAVLSADAGGGPYAQARQMAAQRFALQDQVPALEAASAGNVAPDDFIKRYVIGGKTNDVQALAQLLQQNAPDTFSEMRNQVGAQLARAGFGNNTAGDASFSPTRYSNALTNFGDSKLGAFYSPDEIAQLHTIGRVGSYINSFPSAAPVNTSNTASALASLVGAGVKKLPYVGPVIESAENKAFVNRALAARLSNAPQAPSTFQQPGVGSALFLPPVTSAPGNGP